MMWLNFQHGARRQSGALRGNPWIGSSYGREVPLQSEVFATKDARNKGVLVLRSLIEDFGGEATGASLSERIRSNAWPHARMEALSLNQVRAVLGELAACGALTLEALDKHDVIARITAEGASLAYVSWD